MPKNKVSDRVRPSLLDTVSALRSTDSTFLTQFEMLAIEAVERLIARSDPDKWPSCEAHETDCVDARAAITKLVIDRQAVEECLRSIDARPLVTSERPEQPAPARERGLAMDAEGKLHHRREIDR